jgi:hypothetical protein
MHLNFSLKKKATIFSLEMGLGSNNHAFSISIGGPLNLI